MHFIGTIDDQQDQDQHMLPSSVDLNQTPTKMDANYGNNITS